MRTTIALTCFVLITCASISYVSRLRIFTDIPSIAIVFGTIISLAFAKYSFKEIKSFSDEVV